MLNVAKSCGRVHPAEIELDSRSYCYSKPGDVASISAACVERINDLREESSQLGMMLEEKNVLISAYANAIRESLKEVEEVEEVKEA